MDGDTVKKVVNVTCNVLKKMNSTNVVSPITLDGNWPRLNRLLMFLSFSTCGTVGNIFMISSVMVESHLRKSENSLIASIAFADFVVNIVVFPIPVIVLLSEIEEIPLLCQMQWFTTVLDFLVCIESSLMIAIENYWRLCNRKDSYITASPRNSRVPVQNATPSFMTVRSAYVAVGTIWCATSAIAAIQMLHTVGLDYCKKMYSPLNPYQLTIVITIVIIPSVITLLIHSKTFFTVRRLMKRNDFKRSHAFMNDYALMKSNVCAHVTFIVFWMPFNLIVASGAIDTVSDNTFYKSFWLGSIKTTIVPYLYCITNHNFRESFVMLFKYCCCKSSAAIVKRQRGNDVRMRIAPRYPTRVVCVPTVHSSERTLIN